MAGLDTSKNREIDALKAGWQSLSEWALLKEMWMYYSQWDYEKWDALRKFIEEQKNPSIEEDRSNQFENEYKKKEEEISEISKKYEDERKTKGRASDSLEYIDNQRKEQEEINAKMREFFSNDMQTYVAETKDSVTSVTAAKDKQINDLKDQLSWIVSEWPKLWEYLSLRRRRLVTINNKIQKLKDNKEKYPKNVLVYLMALTQTSLFWARTWLNRAGIALTWRWKTDNIKDNLQVISDKIRVNSDDSPWTRWLKMQLQQHLLEAKQAYVKKQSASVGLAA